MQKTKFSWMKHSLGLRPYSDCVWWSFITWAYRFQLKSRSNDSFSNYDWISCLDHMKQGPCEIASLNGSLFWLMDDCQIFRSVWCCYYHHYLRLHLSQHKPLALSFFKLLVFSAQVFDFDVASIMMPSYYLFVKEVG